MGDVVATNALTAGDVLYWLAIGNDTPVVYSYECPVDSHVVLAAVQLAAEDDAGHDPVCPIHDVTLASETNVDVTPS